MEQRQMVAFILFLLGVIDLLVLPMILRSVWERQPKRPTPQVQQVVGIMLRVSGLLCIGLGYAFYAGVF